MSGLLHYGCRGPERWLLRLETPFQSGIIACAKTLHRKEYNTLKKQKEGHLGGTVESEKVPGNDGVVHWGHSVKYCCGQVQNFYFQAKGSHWIRRSVTGETGFGKTELLWSMVWKSKREFRQNGHFARGGGQVTDAWIGLVAVHRCRNLHFPIPTAWKRASHTAEHSQCLLNECVKWMSLRH